jgi:hypothetical protein
MAWTEDVRFFRGYDEGDPRPPQARALDLALEAAKEHGRVGLELSLGTQASDRMVGEPTTYTRAWFDAWPDAADGTPVLVRARAIKTPQELERMRLANASRSSGRARASAPSRRPPTGPSRSTSRRCSRSGSAPTATGATTRRTSARGTSPTTTSAYVRA